MVGRAGLVVVVGFSLILGFMSLNMARLGRKAVSNMSSYGDATLSHNLALAGTDIGLARFYADTTWRGDTTQNFNGPYFYGSVRYGVSVYPAIPQTVRLQAISSYISPSLPIAETLNDTVRVYLNTSGKSTFSKLAWMTINENSVNWTTGDTVWGMVHSNGTLYVNGSPCFMQKVTTSKNFSPSPGTGTNKAIFKNGYETGVPTKDFPNNLAFMQDSAQARGKNYKNTYPELWITLNPGTTNSGDGFAVVRNGSFTSGTFLDTVRFNNPAFNGVIVNEGRIHVKGKLDGIVSIASVKSSIMIEDTVRYAVNPRSPGNQNDQSCLLGLVADDSVIVADNIANNTDCSIDACIFTLNGSFTAQNYDNSSPKHTNPLYGKLEVLGSIVQKNRGAVGTVSGGVLATGFSKRYRWDDRLTETFKPPAYPEYLTKTYAIVNWWESMRVPNIRE